LKLRAVQQEQEQNKIHSAVNARVLLIRTHAINNNNMTIAIKLLVNAPEQNPSSKPIPNQQPPPIQNQQPPSNNFIKIIETVGAVPVCPPVYQPPRVMVRPGDGSFLQNTPCNKKTPAKFHREEENNARNEVERRKSEGKARREKDEKRGEACASGFAVVFWQALSLTFGLSVQKTIHFNHPLVPVSLLRFMWHQPIASKHHHKPSFFT